MRILQLCFFSNLWPASFDVVSFDIKNGKSVLDLSDNYGADFDLIVSAPPCEQFTKANALNWKASPDYFILVAEKCLSISVNSGKPWIYENPPGRITKFLPNLISYRIATWHGSVTNKEYIVYSNILLLFPFSNRYSKPGSICNLSKIDKELWQKDFFNDLFVCVCEHFDLHNTLFSL